MRLTLNLRNINSLTVDLKKIYTALKQEFKAVSRNGSGKSLKFTNGKLIKELGNRFIYRFNIPVDPDFNIEADRPYILKVNNVGVEGSILIIEEKFIDIELSENHGIYLTLLEIIIDLRILLKLIAKRIIKIDEDSNLFNVELGNYLLSPYFLNDSNVINTKLNHNERK